MPTISMHTMSMIIFRRINFDERSMAIRITAVLFFLFSCFVELTFNRGMIDDRRVHKKEHTKVSLSCRITGTKTVLTNSSK